jgi:hypothetical protein
MKDRKDTSTIFVSLDYGGNETAFSELMNAFHATLFDASGKNGNELFMLFLSVNSTVRFFSRTAYESISERIEEYLDDTGDDRPIYIVDAEGWFPETTCGNIFSFSGSTDSQLLAIRESFLKERDHNDRKKTLSSIYRNRSIFVAIKSVRLRKVHLGLARRFGMHGYDLSEYELPQDWQTVFESAMIVVMDKWTCLPLRDEIERYSENHSRDENDKTLFYLAGADSGIDIGHGRIVNGRLFPLERFARLCRCMRRRDRFADRFVKNYRR